MILLEKMGKWCEKKKKFTQNITVRSHNITIVKHECDVQNMKTFSANNTRMYFVQTVNMHCVLEVP